MRRSYLDYAMSVIVSRALPDVRDGLKPVHRRIFYAMHENNYDWNRPYRKSARVVGDVMGKYHPHGGEAIYDAMVRMAQAFSMRLMLIDGQGNFGSQDGDPPAAMRYTEARMARAASTLLEDLDLDTVDFQENYDSSTSEPVVLPARFPNLLVNGAGGIAVGMATNVPPHNLGEVTDATLALIDNPDMGLHELLMHIPGPDFPTGGLVMGRTGITSAYATGRGSVVMRGRTMVEEGLKSRESIVVTEVPYQVNKARMIGQIAEGVREKRIEGVSALRDESDREGVRVVVELKRDATPSVVLNQLYKFTGLQTTFGVNMLALHEGVPVQLTLKEILEAFLAFRKEVITKRTRHLLAKARARAHTLLGLAVAVANIDAVVALIRKAADAEEARTALMAKPWPATDIGRFIELIADPINGLSKDGTYNLSILQAKAILDLRLHRLTGLERDEIGSELEETMTRIADFLEILRSRERVLAILRTELQEVREAFASERRTEIVDGDIDADLDDLIEREEMVVTLTREGYVKRMPLAAFRSQRRGGKGRAAMTVKDDDFVIRVFNANTHDTILFFTNQGMVHVRKVYNLPQGTPQARGRPMVNVLPLKEDEKVTAVMPWPAPEESGQEPNLIFATRSGTVRRNRLSDFSSIRANGKIAMKLGEGDSLIEVVAATEADDVLLSTSAGQAVRFSMTEVRVFSGRSSKGVRGVRLGKDDEVIGMTPLRHTSADAETRTKYLRYSAALHRGEKPTEDLEQEEVALAKEEEFILTVTEKGFGKRTSSHEYRSTARGGKGVRNIQTSERNGRVVGSFPVADEDEIMLATDAGRIIRCPVRDIRIAGRSTQGVRLFRIDNTERVVSVTLIEAGRDEEIAEFASDNTETSAEVEQTSGIAMDGEVGTVPEPKENGSDG